MKMKIENSADSSFFLFLARRFWSKICYSIEVVENIEENSKFSPI